MRILVVEDEAGIATILKAGLESEYFAVDVAKDGQQGSYLARTNEYDVIVLDNILPKKTGAQICEELRRLGIVTPIIMLSARGGMEIKVNLLNMGADDYLTKPFSFQELVARIRALLRRSPTFESDFLQVDDLTMDLKRHVTKRGDTDVYLTRKEFMLLELLLRRKGATVSRGTILEHVWNMNIDPFSNTVEAHIMNIRRKISMKGGRPLIQTLPGIGYRIDEHG